MSRRIAVLGNPVLRTPPPPVVDFDLHLARRVERMTEIMHATEGLGLAATQVAYFRQVFVWDAAGNAGAMCNPEIVERSEETAYEMEGCLSIPGLSIALHRAESVTLVGFTPKGKERRIEASGLLARVFQHESDHLAGTLIIDRTTGQARAATFASLRQLDIEVGAMTR